jgi:hypothetical protein
MTQPPSDAARIAALTADVARLKAENAELHSDYDDLLRDNTELQVRLAVIGFECSTKAAASQVRRSHVCVVVHVHFARIRR